MPDVFACHKEPKKAKPKWGKPIPQASEKRKAKFDLHDHLRQRVFARDGGCVLHGETDLPCQGRDTVHHRRKAGDSGAWSMRNLVTLCWFHNTNIEDRPDYYRTGWPWLVVRAGDAEYDALKAKR